MENVTTSTLPESIPCPTIRLTETHVENTGEQYPVIISDVEFSFYDTVKGINKDNHIRQFSPGIIYRGAFIRTSDEYAEFNINGYSGNLPKNSADITIQETGKVELKKFKSQKGKIFSKSGVDIVSHETDNNYISEQLAKVDGYNNPQTFQEKVIAFILKRNVSWMVQAGKSGEPIRVADANRMLKLFRDAGGMFWENPNGEIEAIPFWRRRSILPRNYYLESHNLIMEVTNTDRIDPKIKFKPFCPITIDDLNNLNLEKNLLNLENKPQPVAMTFEVDI